MFDSHDFFRSKIKHKNRSYSSSVLNIIQFIFYELVKQPNNLYHQAKINDEFSVNYYQYWNKTLIKSDKTTFLFGDDE